VELVGVFGVEWVWWVKKKNYFTIPGSLEFILSSRDRVMVARSFAGVGEPGGAGYCKEVGL